MSNYLEEAAALLRKAAETNERVNCDRLASKRLDENRLKYAQGFAELAAIEKGLLPDRLATKYSAEVREGRP